MTTPISEMSNNMEVGESCRLCEKMKQFTRTSGQRLTDLVKRGQHAFEVLLSNWGGWKVELTYLVDCYVYHCLLFAHFSGLAEQRNFESRMSLSLTKGCQM